MNNFGVLRTNIKNICRDKASPLSIILYPNKLYIVGNGFIHSKHRGWFCVLRENDIINTGDHWSPVLRYIPYGMRYTLVFLYKFFAVTIINELMLPHHEMACAMNCNGMS